MLDGLEKFRRNPDIIIKSIGGHYVALDIENGGEYTLNEVSYSLLENLAKPLTMKDLIEITYETYDVSRDVLYEDIHKWIDQALSLKLIIMETNQCSQEENQ